MKTLPSLPRLLTIASVLVLIGPGFHASVQAGVSGYLMDTWGNPVRSDYGECWHTGSWDSGDHLDACDGTKNQPEESVARPEAEATPVVPESEPKPESEPVMESKVIGLVHFEFDASDIRPNAANLLEELVVQLRLDDSIEKITIKGHTDNVGTEPYNDALGLRRAESVRDFLAKRGLRNGLFEVRSMGEQQPLDENRTAEGRALNRRVEIEVIRRRPIQQ